MSCSRFSIKAVSLQWGYDTGHTQQTIWCLQLVLPLKYFYPLNQINLNFITKFTQQTFIKIHWNSKELSVERWSYGLRMALNRQQGDGTEVGRASMHYPTWIIQTLKQRPKLTKLCSTEVHCHQQLLRWVSYRWIYHWFVGSHLPFIHRFGDLYERKQSQPRLGLQLS